MPPAQAQVRLVGPLLRLHFHPDHGTRHRLRVLREPKGAVSGASSLCPTHMAHRRDFYRAAGGSK